MVAYRITHGCGRLSTGDTVIVHVGEIPEIGDYVLLKDESRLECDEYRGQVTAVGKIVGVVPEGKLKRTA